jgi:3-oxoacyl-[acyl-carrier protein] reductase
MQLEGRIALVTGGAQGIGAGICEGLAGAGAAVAIVDLQIEKARDLAQRLSVAGCRAVPIAADISNEEGCRSAVAQTVDALGGLDILVNNAAPGRNRDMLGRIAGADWTAHEQVVLQAAVNLVDAALPRLAAGERGAIVNVSSIIGSAVGIDQCSWPYHVSKAGLNQLTRWLAGRLGPSGVRVNAVAPGLVDRDVGPKLTDQAANRAVVEAVVPLRRAGRASDIAQAVIFLCSEQSAYITGQVLTVDGGLGLAEVFGASLRAYQASRSGDSDS